MNKPVIIIQENTPMNFGVFLERCFFCMLNLC